MKQYLLSVHIDESAPDRSPEEIQRSYEEVDALNAELRSRSCRRR